MLHKYKPADFAITQVAVASNSIKLVIQLTIIIKDVNKWETRSSKPWLDSNSGQIWVQINCSNKKEKNQQKRVGFLYKILILEERREYLAKSKI